MSRQFTQKSFIFTLIVLAAAAVVFFLVWNAMEEFNQVEPPNPNPPGGALIESTSVSSYDSELDQELESFDNDSADLINLQNDPSIENIDQDLSNLNF